MAGTESHYVVVVHVETTARFKDEPIPIRVVNLGTDVGPVEMILRTRYSDEGYDVHVPRELWIDVRGVAACTLEEAAIAYAKAAGALMGLIAVSANVAVGDALPKIAFDNTPGRRERPHLQIFVPEARGQPMPGRAVNVAATGALFVAVDKSSETERLHRAMEQYRLALVHWKPGHEILALMHLFMGMEALTKAALRQECSRLALTEDELCLAWGIERNQLDPEVRRRILFQNDNATMAGAKRASDGLEHGFMAFPTIRTHAEAARDRTAELLRLAIFRVAELDATTMDLLTSDPYERPSNPWIARYIRSKLTTESDDLAAPDQEYPLAHWSTKLKALRRDGELYEFETTDETTWRLGAGVRVEAGRFEVWGSERREGPPVQVEPTVIRNSDSALAPSDERE